MSRERETIYVALLDEGIDVWRPVVARQVSADTYLILDQNYDREVETWEFEPRTLVRCRKEQRNGRQIRVATEIARRPSTALHRKTDRLRPAPNSVLPVHVTCHSEKS